MQDGLLLCVYALFGGEQGVEMFADALPVQLYNVKAKSGLNKSILDQGWYEFRRQLEYKQHWLGGDVVAVKPQYTSQTCSSCGHICKDNRKSQADFKCVACGHAENADINAAKNILASGHGVLACGAGSLEL